MPTALQIGAMKWVKVIVTSIDFDGNAGYSFYAEDATDGINIWNLQTERLHHADDGR